MSRDRYRSAGKWTYESIVNALPGVDFPPAVAVGVQFVLFEAGVLGLGYAYGLSEAVLPGTVAVAVAAVGSAFMLDLGRRTRELDVGDVYESLLFGSSIEVVLALLAFSALLTYLFVADPRADPVLLDSLFGERPPLPAVYLSLLVLWDVCYRIGTGWWTAVVACWRSLAGGFGDATARELRRLDRRTAAFAAVQLALVPFVLDHPVLLWALVGHAAAVGVVTGLSTLLLRRS